jgi:hypothetical protein
LNTLKIPRKSTFDCSFVKGVPARVAQESVATGYFSKSRPVRFAGPFLSARVGHICSTSVLSFACPKESTKEKGSLSGGANDLRGLRCF